MNILHSNEFTVTVAWLSYVSLHSLFATLTLKNFLKENVKPLFYYHRLLYNLFAVASFSIAFSFQLQLEPYYFLENSLFKTIFGYTGIVSGILVIVFTFVYSYPLLEFAGLEPSKQGGALLTRGLSKKVRHPLYLGVFLICWGGFIAYTHSLTLVQAIVFTIYIFLGLKLEEKKLLLEHNDYSEYKQRTPFIFPDFFK